MASKTIVTNPAAAARRSDDGGWVGEALTGR
jgi:hypothetical protein